MSHWREDSVLGRFNRAPGGEWFVLPADFARVMEAALAVAERSGGVFDPAIGAQVNLWGHGPEPRQAPRSEEHTSELQSLMRISYAVFCLKKKKEKEEERM